VTTTIIAVHGIGNYRPVPADEATAALTAHLNTALTTGLRAHRPDLFDVRLHAAYYADLLQDRGVQTISSDDQLTAEEEELLAAWAQAIGLPEEVIQGRAGIPLRLVCDWVARWVGHADDTAYRRSLARSVANLVRDVAGYINHPNRRAAARDKVAEAIAERTPQVIIAHSLGSVVTYETLWAHPELSVDLLLTVGSPLALPGAIFDRLEPAPTPNFRHGTGQRPPKVRRWINIADTGDLVAVPRPLHVRFDGLSIKDDHQTSIGPLSIHNFSRYLQARQTAVVLDEHL
jgi:hypothetical protein